MKLRYFFAALAAVFTLGLTVGCSDEFEPTYLDDIKVSNSYITFSQHGGSESITLTTKSDWTINEAPEGFTVSPMSGSAGETTVTISTEATELSKTGTVVINCNGKQQYLNLQQEGASYPDFQEGQYWIMFNLDGKWIVAKPCTAEIGNGSSYAYIFCDEATGSLEDGTLASTAANVYTFKKAGSGFHVSDSEGGYLWQSGTYNNFYRAAAGGDYIWSVKQVGAQAYQVESNTSHVLCYSPGYNNVAAYASLGDNLRPYLVPVKELAPEVITLNQTSYTVSSEAGKLLVPAKVEADELTVNYDAEWLRYQGQNGEGLIFSYAANNAGARTATVTLHGIYGDYEKDVELTIVQNGSSGTLDMPMTPTEAVAYCRALGSGNTTSSDLYVKGVISKVKYEYSAQYGTATFWISEDGTYNEENPDDNFQCYSVQYLGFNKWAEGNGQIGLGAEVVICGKLTQYNNTSETASGKAYLYSINGVTTDANGIGTQASPFNIAGGIAAGLAGTKAKVYVKGIVSELYKGGFDPAYGNGSFYMSEDGVRHKDNALDFEAYQVFWLGGEKWIEGTHPQIAVGDNVTIYGPLTVYNGLVETQGKGAAYIHEYTPAK